MPKQEKSKQNTRRSNNARNGSVWPSFIEMDQEMLARLREMHRSGETRPEDGAQASDGEPSRYRAYTVRNFRDIPQVQMHLTEEQRFAIEVVSHVLPFKTNSYVVDELINWKDVSNDAMFVLNFPQKDMLKPGHFREIASLMQRGAEKADIDKAVHAIRMDLNPHPAGQMDHNVPMLDGQRLTGMQHKYRETVLFFPSNGQTCHAYCTFCFRWPQFVGMDELKFAMRETELLTRYVREHPEVTNVLFTGGDPMIMRTRNFARYVEPLLEERPGNLSTIRIGTKALGYWPYRFVTDEDAEEMLALFRRITQSGLHLSVMAHFNHPQEMSTDVVKEAIRRIRETGAQIRTQSPLMKNINDDSQTWAEMWREQEYLGCIPYYMFVARDTGAQHYFNMPLVRAWEIYRDAHNAVSGLGRTVRGPSMSADPGKVEVLGVAEIAGEKVIALRMLQGRNPDWAMRPFYAEYDEKAAWLNELKPAFGEEKFFFEDELQEMYRRDKERYSRSRALSTIS